MLALRSFHHVETAISWHTTVAGERDHWKGEQVQVYLKPRGEYEQDPNAPLSTYRPAVSSDDSLAIVGYHKATPVGGRPIFDEKLEPENDVVGIIVTVIGPEATALLEMPGGALQPPVEFREPSMRERLLDPAVLAVVALALLAGLLIGRAWARRRS